jgi:hypothetical protein
MVNEKIGRKASGAGRRVEGARRAVLLLLTIGALLFVGMQSRVAQSLPTRASQQLLTSFSDPVKFPPPEERASPAAGWFATVPIGPVVVPPLPRFRGDAPAAVSYVGERHAGVHLLRAPPPSL